MKVETAAPRFFGISLILALAASSALAAAPGDTLHLSLEDCIASAMSSGEEMRLAEAQRALAKAAYLQARSAALPQLILSTTYTRQIESVFRNGAGTDITPFEPDTLQMDPLIRIRDIERALPTVGLSGLAQLFSATSFGSENSWAATLSVAQKLLDGGSLWNSIIAARHALRAAEGLQGDASAQIMLRVREAYLAALLADRGERIAQLGVEQAESQLQRVSLRAEAGEASEFELLQAQVQRDNQIPVLTHARSLRDLAYLELGRVANLPAATPVALSTPLLEDAAMPAKPAVVDTTGLVGEALQAPGVVALEEILGARAAAVAVSASGRWPSLAAFGSFSEQAYPRDVFPGQDDWTRDIRAGVELNWSLFDGFRTRGAVQQAEAQRSEALQNLRQARELTRTAVVQNCWDLQRAAADLHARSRTVELARRAFELARLRYDEGASDLLEVADARIAYQMAQTHEAQARHDYFVALARLERYTGRSLFPVTNTPGRDSGER